MKYILMVTDFRAGMNDTGIEADSKQRQFQHVPLVIGIRIILATIFSCIYIAQMRNYACVGKNPKITLNV